MRLMLRHISVGSNHCDCHPNLPCLFSYINNLVLAFIGILRKNEPYNTQTHTHSHVRIPTALHPHIPHLPTHRKHTFISPHVIYITPLLRIQIPHYMTRRYYNSWIWNAPGIQEQLLKPKSHHKITFSSDVLICILYPQHSTSAFYHEAIYSDDKLLVLFNLIYDIIIIMTLSWPDKPSGTPHQFNIVSFLPRLSIGV